MIIIFLTLLPFHLMDKLQNWSSLGTPGLGRQKWQYQYLRPQCQQDSIDLPWSQALAMQRASDDLAAVCLRSRTGWCSPMPLGWYPDKNKSKYNYSSVGIYNTTWVPEVFFSFGGGDLCSKAMATRHEALREKNNLLVQWY